MNKNMTNLFNKIKDAKEKVNLAKYNINRKATLKAIAAISAVNVALVTLFKKTGLIAFCDIDVTKGTVNLYTIFMNVITAVGAILAVFGFLKAIKGFKDMQSDNGQSNGLVSGFTILIIGLLMCVAKTMAQKLFGIDANTFNIMNGIS